MLSNSQFVDQLVSGHFIALDFETTGLDPEENEILEIGYVRVVSGKIEERYSQLVNPVQPIPPFIQKLTGISQDDVLNQPALRDVLPDLVRVCAEHPVVMHNAPFDFSFLRAASKRWLSSSALVSSDQILDTLLLSRIFYPFAPSHRLGELAAFFELEVSPTHRALDDAETTAHLVFKILEKCQTIDPAVFHQLLQYMDGAFYGLRFLLTHFAENKPTGLQLLNAEEGPDNIIGQVERKTASEKKQKLSKEEILDYFSSGGKLEKRIPRFESRTPQVEMAQAIATCINRDEILIAEAGTGVGKSLAYLIPFLENANRNAESRFIVATHTKTLQEQLFYKDLPVLESVMPFAFKGVLLKGRSNYICLRRFHSLLDQLHDRISENQKEAILSLLYWLFVTKTGDIEENSSFHTDYEHHIWSMINAGEGLCLKSKCAFEKRCYLQRVRRESKSADVVVVNHSLLFANLTNNQSIIGPFSSLVVDEAHHLEEVASQYLGESLCFSDLAELCQSLYQKRPKRHGLLVAIEDVVKAAILNESVEKEVLKQIKGLIKQTGLVFEAGHQFFTVVENSFFKKETESDEFQKIRFPTADSLFGAVRFEFFTLLGELVTLQKTVKEFLDNNETASWQRSRSAENLTLELMSMLDNMRMLSERLQYFQSIDFSETVVWLERVTQRGNRELVLQAVPLDIASKLANKLYPEIKNGVFTSATLTINSKFDYLLNRWGFNFVAREQFTCQSFGSPFDYDAQMHFLVSDFLPDPRHGNYVFSIATLIKEIILSTRRGTLILFTSFSMLKQVYQILEPAMLEAGLLLLGQGIDGSRSVLLQRFKNNQHSILLGTNSFWEGVDVPGESLEILIITKIPFSVPSDPLVQARSELATNRFGNGFLNYSVPEAIVQFKQGFGRLIRTGRDRGIILMLDHRVVTSQYGRLFLSSVPVEAEIHHNRETLIHRIEDWFLE